MSEKRSLMMAALLPCWWVWVAAAATALACRMLGTHRVLRWPIFLLIASCIAFDIVCYVLVRLAIRTMHSLGPIRKRELALEQCQTYEDWLAAAKEADTEEGRDVWRAQPQSDEYDWRHISATVQRLRSAREAGDAGALMALLLPSLKTNAFGELQWQAYSKSRAGTKHLLESYRAEVCASLRALAAMSPQLQKLGGGLAFRDFCVAARASYGGAALVLSGGALFGVFHFEGSLPSHGLGVEGGAGVPGGGGDGGGGGGGDI